MKPFKFFKGTLNNPEMINEPTRATASFYQNPEQLLLDIQRQRIRDAETAYRFRSSGAGRATRMTHTDNHGNTDYVPFSIGNTRVTRPKQKSKIKTLLQESWLYDPVGVVVVSILVTIVTIIGIAKLLGA